MCKSTICGLLLCLCLLPLAAPAPAAEVKGLYEAEMYVPDQSRRERGLAMSAALAEVVTRVSGRPDARLRPGVAKAIRQSARLLQQYRYRALPPALREADLPGDDPQRIFFRFDRLAVDRLLRDNGLPVWGATRPVVLAWVVVEDTAGRRLLAADNPQPLRGAVVEAAQRLGLPLILPLMDLQDETRVSVGDVWGRFLEPVRRASQRYHPEVLLLGRLFRDPSGDWQADWRVDEDGVGEQWHSDGALADEAVNAGMLRLLDWLSARYAPLDQGEAGRQLIFTVLGVHSLADFARVDRYLRSLQQVATVQPRVFADDRVEFVLALHVGVASLVQTIALGRMLVPAEEAIAIGTPVVETPVPAITTTAPPRRAYRLLH